MKAHDVRRMATCRACGELGFERIAYDDELAPLLRHNGGLYHPQCLPDGVLLELPADELKRVRLCDVDTPTMRKLLARLEKELKIGGAQ